MSRVVAGEFLLGEVEKEVFRRMLRRVAGFSGVEVIAYCVMSNHFHVLVRVPEASALSDEALLEQYRLLYTEAGTVRMPPPSQLAKLLGGEQRALWRERIVARLFDVTEFMRTLKQRFTFYYNKKHGRFGTLWAEKFTSVVVEDDPNTVSIVAAYIDLNAVRAGLVEDPADYRWCSFAEAQAGGKEAQAGLISGLRLENWKSGAAAYRLILYGKGGNGDRGAEGIIPAEKVHALIASGGKVPWHVLLRCKLKYMHKGAILGSETFVRELAEALLPEAKDKAAKKQLAKLPAEGDIPLFAWRKIQKNPFR